MYGEEDMVLKQVDPNYENHNDIEAKKIRKIQLQTQEEEEDLTGDIEANLYGTGTGGYVRAPMFKGGYISAPMSGGWVAPVLATVAPFLLDLLGITGQSGSGIHKQYSRKSGGAFFRDMHRDLSRVDPVVANKVISHLVGPKYHFRGTKAPSLKFGHLLMPMLKHHIPRMMKGVKKSDLLTELEEHPLMNQDFEVTGSGIWDTLWGGIKKIFTSDTAKKLGSKVIDKALPSIAEKAIDFGTKKIEDYIDDKARGPKLTRDDVKRMREQIKNYEDEGYVRDNLAKLKQKRRPPVQVDEDEEDEEIEYVPEEKTRRKEIISNRKALVPANEVKTVATVPPVADTRKILYYTKNGRPVYGSGLKKKSGGAWKITLTRN